MEVGRDIGGQLWKNYASPLKDRIMGVDPLEATLQRDADKFSNAFAASSPRDSSISENAIGSCPTPWTTVGARQNPFAKFAAL